MLLNRILPISVLLLSSSHSLLPSRLVCHRWFQENERKFAVAVGAAGVVRDVTTWTLTSAKSDVASCGWSLQETIDPNYLQLTLCMIDEMNRASQTEASSEPEGQEPETEHDSGVTVVEVTSNSGSGTGSMTAMRLEDHGSDNLFTLVRAMGSISSQSLLRPMELVKSIWEAAVLVLGHERVRSLYNSISEQTMRRGGNVSDVQVFLEQGLEGTFAPQRVTN